METSQLLEMATVPDYKMDSVETERVEKTGLLEEDEQVCINADFLETADTNANIDNLADLQKCMTETNEHDGNEPEITCQKEALVLESAHNEINRTESMTSSVSDTPSSAESVYESEMAPKRRDLPDKEQPDYCIQTMYDTKDSNITDTTEQQQQDVILENHDPNKTEESVLEQCIREEASSDVSTESDHELDQDDFSECLRVEIEAVSSDSETDEKWRAIFSSSINKEDDDDFMFDNIQNQSAQELFIQRSDKNMGNLAETNQAVEPETQAGKEVLEQPEHYIVHEFQMQEHSNNALGLFHGLSKISEDEDELSQGLKQNVNPLHSAKVDTYKVPPDYCVIQETKSENVSNEHVDFRVARKQWLKMEEETKGQVHQPVIKQSACQGGHNFMYTPVRNIDRPKRELESDCLMLSEYPQTHFSPCSEDSGLDDSSYRSPYDDPETPIEREIRLAMEREENLRRERGIAKPATTSECPVRVRPVILLPGKFDKKLSQEIDERRKVFETQEDGCRIQRAKPPSFVITSSPSRGQLYHDMAANNIIILEPDPYSSSPVPSMQDTVLSPLKNKSNEWPETSNVIILETSNLIIRSASEFSLNSAGQDTQESTFLNNPFFKLRSRSTQSLIDEEIKMVKLREEELKKQRESVYAKEKYNAILGCPNLMDSLSFDKSELPVRCKSSPSSPMKSAYKMDCSTLSCEYKSPDAFSGVRRKSAMALRWEEGVFTNQE